ncbi:hypothetical protein ACH4PU_03005 [Streptomyces sp. NPDC021100]|uniref:hypothetical protein n=1 Tax=Streptomyces sp. NPDC021100 TaxID=3365114 RepID=UPI0037A909A7
MSGNGREDGMDGKGKEFLDFPGSARLRAAGRVEPPPADVVAAALEAVRAAACAEGGRAPEEATPVSGTRVPDTGGAVPLRARWRRRAPALVSAAAVMAVAVGAAVWAGPGFGGGRVGVADTAEDPSDPSEGVAPYWEAQTDFLYQAKGFPDRSVTRQTTWYSRDAVWIRSADGTLRQEGGSGHSGTGFTVNGVDIPWDDFAKLPADPKALKGKFGYKGSSTDGMALGTYYFNIEEILARSPAPSRLRAAFGELLASTPGIRSAGTVKDSKGRTGTGIDYISGNERFRVILDPRTHRALETAQTLVNDAPADDRFWAGLKAGAPLIRSTYLVSQPLWKKPPELPPQPSGSPGTPRPGRTPARS